MSESGVGDPAFKGRQGPPLLVDLSNDVSRAKADPAFTAEVRRLRSYRRATDYLAAAMVFLKNNTLLNGARFHLDEKKVVRASRGSTDISAEDIKDRLLGHWGTCPGINLLYAHINRLLVHQNQDVFFVCGPGHGAPAVLSNLFVEGSLTEFYPDLDQSNLGAWRLIRGFSWPGGFPSHTSAEVPGTINEGGELGCAVCLVGDGEAETGPTATSWHGFKFLDPKEGGAVLPVLHLNGYKISNATVFGSMTDSELGAFFSGLGYKARHVGDNDLESIDYDLAVSLEWAFSEIRRIQAAFRSTSSPPQEHVRWPMIILRVAEGLGLPTASPWKERPAPTRSRCRTRRRIRRSCRRSGTGSARTGSASSTTTKDAGLKMCGLSCRPRSGAWGESGRCWLECPLPPLPGRIFTPTRPLACSLSRKSIVDSFALLETNQALWKSPESTWRRSSSPTARFRVFSPDEMESNKLSGILTATNRNFQWIPPPRPVSGTRKH